MERISGNGVELAFDRRGQGPPVVLVHPILCRLEYWEPHRHQLSADFETIAYDCRGHGASEKPDSAYGIHDHVEDLRALIDALRLCDPALVGYSMGAYIVAGVLCRHPGVASRAVVVSGKIAGRRATSARHIAIDRIVSGADALDQVTAKVFHGDPDPVHVAFLRLLAREMSPADVERAIASAGGFDLEPDLPRLELPLLVMHGADDMLNPVSEARRMVELAPRARLVVADECGHELPFERPQLFRERVLEFLA